MEGPFSAALMFKGWSEAITAETSGILLNSKLQEKVYPFPFFQHHSFYVQPIMGAACQLEDNMITH